MLEVLLPKLNKDFSKKIQKYRDKDQLIFTFIAWLHVYTQNAAIWLAEFWDVDHLYVSV